MAISRKLDYVILNLIESAAKTVKAAPMNLGAYGGAAGGVGGPPGGIIGWLRQTSVAYDEDELATLDTAPSGLASPSGWSLLDNLNHIRYRLGALESGILVVDEYDGDPSISGTTWITFSGPTVSDLGGGHVLVAFSGGGGSMPSPFALPNDITPSIISSTQNDYNPSGLNTADVLRLEASGATRIITGLQGGSDGRIIILYNIGTTFTIQLNTESGSSSPENRFLFTGVNNVSLAPNTSIALIYDSTVSRWRAINSNATSLQGAPITAGLLGATDGSVLYWDDGAGYFDTANVEDLITPLIVDDYDGSPSTSPTYQVTFSGFTLTNLGGGHMLVQNPTPSGGVALTVEDDDGSPSVTNVDKIIIQGGSVTDNGGGDVLVSVYGDGPQAFAYNYKITIPTSVATSAVINLKTLAGNDPSTTDPIILRIGNTRREVTSALSFTVSNGTNWCNMGSAELADKSVNLFIYAIDETGASAGVKLGMSRIPYARSMGDFVNTATDEKYIKGNWTNFNGSDKVENIGRITGSVSTASNYYLNFLTSETYIVSRPIYETERLEYVPQWVGFTTQPGVIFNYYVVMSTIFIYAMASGDLTSNSTSTSATLPFTCATVTGFLPRNSTSAKNNGTLATTPGMATITSADNKIIYYRDFAATAWTNSGTKQVYSTEIYYPIV